MPRSRWQGRAERAAQERLLQAFRVPGKGEGVEECIGLRSGVVEPVTDSMMGLGAMQGAGRKKGLHLLTLTGVPFDLP